MPTWINPTQTPTYFSWKDMRRRCSKEDEPAWKNYGGRGIRVCERWWNSYDAFVEDMGLKPEGTTLEREDNDGHYEPGNCRWATRAEQSVNHRRNRYLEYQGKRQRLTDWARDLGISSSTLHERLTKGYSDALIFHVGPIAPNAVKRVTQAFDL